MKKSAALYLFIFFILPVFSKADGRIVYLKHASDSTAPVYPGYHLVWHDEFNGDKLNMRDWRYETGGHGWGNSELEFYQAGDSNVFLSKGCLVIEARKQDRQNRHYTSARINTAGKREFLYGRIDIRAKLPVLPGMWPALWMLGNDIDSKGWPFCGEIDIMELIGKNPGQVVGSFHWKKDDGTEGTINNRYDLKQEDFSKNFHLYSLVWEKDSYRILVDNKVYVTATAEDLKSKYNAFQHPYYLLFNVAVGGDWPGPPDETTRFPQRMEVDYVRVYQH